MRCNAKRAKAVSPSVGAGYTVQAGIHTIGSVPVTTSAGGTSERVGANFWRATFLSGVNSPTRMLELRARNAEKCQLSRDQAIQYLVEILKTPIAEVTVDHRLAQSYDAKSGKIELPNKLSAMQLLAKMCGWAEPEKHEFEHGFKERQELIEVIVRLRGRGAYATISAPDKGRG